MLLLAPRDPEISLAKFIMTRGDHVKLRQELTSIEGDLAKLKLTGKITHEDKFWILEIKPPEGSKMTHTTMVRNTEKFAKKLKKRGYSVIGI